MKASHNTPDNTKILEFFDKTIDDKDFAKKIRRINYIIALTVMRCDDSNNALNKEWAEDGFFWLNELAEILDPNMDID